MGILSFLFVLVSLKTALAATDAERLCVLEKKMDVLEPAGIKSALKLIDSDRIAALERRMESLELLCTARCGLERHCLVPSVQHGQARCPEKMPPGSQCSVECDPGYIATPGKDTTNCKKDGFWTRDMQCEIPLVVVSGGSVDQASTGDSSVEVLSLYPSTGCDINIPNMPLADGSHRSLHNLLYLPMKKRMVACNGLTNTAQATCDIWDVKNNTWKQHTFPNKGNEIEESACKWGMGGSVIDCKGDRLKGRYASEARFVGGKAYILGGMVYDKQGHEPTSSIRVLHETDGPISRYDKEYWHGRSNKMNKKRAFFCSAKVKDGGILSIGGLGRNETGNTVEKSVEYKSVGWIGKLPDISKFSDMTIPRSGHSCTEVPGSNFTVIVSGGTMGFGQPAMASAEIFDWNSNSWKNIANMNEARFGHAVVAIGDKIFAIGGDDRNPNNVLATIEEYDFNRNSWKIVETKLKKPRSQFGVTLLPHSIFTGCVVSDPLQE